MPLLKSKYQSELHVAKLNKLLEKIRIVSGLRASRFVVRKGNHIWKGNELVSFEVDEAQDTGTIILDAGPLDGVGLKAVLQVQDIEYEAVNPGTLGNSITIEYTGGATAGAEVVTVVDNAIQVQIEHQVSTATQVKAAIDGSAEAIALVTATINGTAGLAQDTFAEAPLEGADDVQTFDKADIVKIRRLRTKKYMIVLADDADPAE
jgi:hypothetical protein